MDSSLTFITLKLLFSLNYYLVIVKNHIVVLVYGPLPSSMTDPEHQKGQIQMMINMGVGRADGGFASHYDYENNRWKSMP